MRCNLSPCFLHHHFYLFITHNHAANWSIIQPCLGFLQYGVFNDTYILFYCRKRRQTQSMIFFPAVVSKTVCTYIHTHAHTHKKNNPKQQNPLLNKNLIWAVLSSIKLLSKSRRVMYLLQFILFTAQKMITFIKGGKVGNVNPTGKQFFGFICYHSLLYLLPSKQQQNEKMFVNVFL